MKLKSSVFTAAVAIALAGCGDSRDVQDAATPARLTETADTAADDTQIGTGGAVSPAPEGQAAAQAGNGELPGTASPMSTIALAGILALGAAGGLRALRR